MPLGITACTEWNMDIYFEICTTTFFKFFLVLNYFFLRLTLSEWKQKCKRKNTGNEHAKYIILTNINKIKA